MEERAGPVVDHSAEIDACIIDLDGTLTAGEGLTLGASELVAAAGDAFVVLSNNSSHSPPGLAQELASLRLDIPVERIVLAGAETLRLLANETPGARVMLLGSSELEQLAVIAGLVLVETNPHIVVIARDEHFSYDRITRAANAVRRGAQLVATNADLTHPGAEGHIVPETGALLAAVRACCPDAACRVIGKPEPHIFAEALRILGTRPERTAVIGDNPTTDGAGARHLGMPYLQVKDCDVRSAARWVRAQMQRPSAAR